MLLNQELSYWTFCKFIKIPLLLTHFKWDNGIYYIWLFYEMHALVPLTISITHTNNLLQVLLSKHKHKIGIFWYQYKKINQNIDLNVYNCIILTLNGIFNFMFNYLEKYSCSKPFERFTPSHRYPGIIWNRFGGGGGPLYTGLPKKIS